MAQPGIAQFLRDVADRDVAAAQRPRRTFQPQIVKQLQRAAPTALQTGAVQMGQRMPQPAGQFGDGLVLRQFGLGQFKKALGQGARAKVIDQINAMGTNTIEIFPGKGWGDEKMASIQTLNKGDLDALLGQPYLAGASPEIGSSGQLRYRNKTNSGNVTGVGNDYF